MILPFMQLQIQERGIQSLQGSFEAEGALFEGPKLLEAEGHVVHRQVHHHPVGWILLKL